MHRVHPNKHNQFTLVGTRDVRTQSAHAQPAHTQPARAHAQSVPSPARAHAQSVPSSCPCPCPIRAQPAFSQALSQTNRPSELIYMIYELLPIFIR
jgi:hypothetical protein